MTKTFKLNQLLPVVTGQLFYKHGVCDTLGHICDSELFTHQLPAALSYVKLKNPTWFVKVKKEIMKCEAKLDKSPEMLQLINIDGGADQPTIDKRRFLVITGMLLANDVEFQIPQLKDEFDTSDFADFMAKNPLSLKQKSK